MAASLLLVPASPALALDTSAPEGFQNLSPVLGPGASADTLSKIIFATQNIVSYLEEAIHSLPQIGGDLSPALAIIAYAAIVKLISYPVYARAVKYPYLLRREL